MTSSSQVTTQFSGISDTSSDPPHNALAVGPNYIVMAEGSRIEWTNLSGGSANLQSVYQFFGSLGSTATNGLFDPRAVYDSVYQRYVVTMDNIGSNGAISNVDIAVSKDSNPNDGWYFYSLNTSLTINGQLTAADQPIVSVDGTNVYITVPQYDVNVSGFAGTEQWVIGDTVGADGGIYNGGTMTVVASQLAAPGQGMTRVVAGNNGQTYYASAVNTGSQTLITLQTYSLATNSFGPSTTVSLGNIDQGGGGADFKAQQQGTSVPLDAGDGHIQNLAYANGFLYGVSEVLPIGSSAPQVHWFKIDVSNPSNPVLVAQGNVSGASIGAGVATFDGSIAVDQSGDVIINFTVSGPNMYPADYYGFLSAGDQSSAFSAPVLYQASASYLANGDGRKLQRWGIYSTAIADPNHQNSFWLSSEYVANGWWQTSVAQVAIQTPTTTVTERLLNDTGASSSDKITGNATLAGSGSANAVVSFAVDGNLVSSTATADSTGAWIFSPTGLQDGQHTMVASETDALGNGSSASLTFTLDTTPPAVTIGNSGGTATQATLTVTGTVSDPDLSGPGTTVAIFDGATQVGTATVQADGSWSSTISLTNGTNSLTAKDTDIAGNAGTSAPITYTYGPSTVNTIATSGPGITNGTGDLNAGKTVMLTVTFSAAVTVNTAGGSPQLLLNDGGIAAYSGGSGTTALTFAYTVAAGQNTADLIVSSLSLSGSIIADAAGTSADVSGAANYNPAGTLQIDTTAPAIAINTISGNNSINASVASSGFAISGTTTNAENGQTVTVNLVNSQNVVVDSYATSDQNNAWSVNVTSKQALALVDGVYVVTADVADNAGNLSPLATRSLTVEEDDKPEAPTLAIASSALTVPAGGSVALEITATPIDSDDSVTVKIAGLPSYETITAPKGDHVSKALQSNGTYTWTISEISSTAGKPLTGLTLTSSYGGTGQPVATLTVTASNTTSGETANSPSQTITVTDPPATNPTPNLLALLNQYAASGFHGDRSDAGEITPAWAEHGGQDVLALLSAPGHFQR